MKTLTITAVSQITNLFRSHPSLYDIPSLSSLKSSVSELPKTTGCSGCGGGAKITPKNNIKTQMEIALTSLTTADYQKIKDILKIDKLCYYKNINGKFTLLCI